MSFTVFTSSAGSGKTATLVLSYISLLVRNPEEFRRILALTFTNKAAAEMKDRIIQSLQLLAREPADSKEFPHWFLEALQRESGFPEDRIISGARAGLSQILHGYHDFHVSTLDSFMHGIVRTFAYDLHLPLQFDIELESEVLLDMAVAPLIARAGIDAELSHILTGFALSKADDEKSWNILADIIGTSKELFREESAYFIDKLSSTRREDLMAGSKELRELSGGFEKEVRRRATETFGKISAFSPSDFIQGQNGFYKTVEDLAKGSRETILKPNKRFKTACQEGVIISKGSRSKAAAELLAMEDDILRSLRDLGEFMEQGIPPYELCRLIQHNLYQVMLLAEVSAGLDTIRQEEQLLHISEFNKRIAEIIRHEPEPFLYERTGNRFRHIFLDEFQDTSVLQWYNMIPLMENALANGGTGLLVGDPKQAIYRFRNGESDLFTSLPNFPSIREFPQLSTDTTALGSQFQQKMLDTNYRSLPVIVNFNNSFFGYTTRTLGEHFHTVYDGGAQKISRDSNEGLAAVLFLEAESKEELMEAMFLRSDEVISDHLAKGYREDEIAVLFRRNSDAAAFAAFLLGRGRRVQSADSLLLRHSAEVRLLLHLLGLLSNPDDQVAAAGMLRYLCKPGENLSAALGKISGGATDAVRSRLLEPPYHLDFSKLSGTDPFRACVSLTDGLGIEVAGNPFLLEFLELLIDHLSRQRTGIPGFLSWFEKHSAASISLPSTQGAIRVMTIHSAKGLQFPVVIYPATYYPESITKKQSWIEVPPLLPVRGIPTALVNLRKDIQYSLISDMYENEKSKSELDEFNVQYVAFTRAQDCLYVMVPAPDNKGANRLSSFLDSYLTSVGDKAEPGAWLTYGSIPEGRTSGPLLEIPERISPATNSAMGMQFSRYQAGFHSEAIDRGLLIHELLAGIHSRDDLEDSLGRVSSKWELASDEMNELREIAIKILAHPGLKALFGSEGIVRTEMKIQLDTDKVLRPDRVSIIGENAFLADFKTGTHRPEHKAQILSYAQALEASGKKVKEKLLVYIGDEVDVMTC